MKLWGFSRKNSGGDIWYSIPSIVGALLGPRFVGTEEQTAVGVPQNWALGSLKISFNYITSECAAFTEDGLLAIPEYV